MSPELAQVKLSQGVAFVHNTIAWKIWPTGDVDERQTPYMFPHDTQIKGYHDCPCGNVCYFNNLLLRENLSMYENSKLPTKMEGNVVDTLGQYRVEEMADGWYLEFIPTKSLSKECTKALVYSQQLGEAVIPRQRIELPDGKKAFDKDYLGRKRKKEGTYPALLNLKEIPGCGLRYMIHGINIISNYEEACFNLWIRNIIGIFAKYRCLGCR